MTTKTWTLPDFVAVSPGCEINCCSLRKSKRCFDSDCCGLPPVVAVHSGIARTTSVSEADAIHRFLSHSSNCRQACRPMR
jgi:hypothetical protein